MKFDTQKIWLNARQASTEDLMDRVTVYRAGMEPEALEIIEAELHDRGITPATIQAHAQNQECLRDADGTALQCCLCRKPAVMEKWGWLRLWDLIPIFPRVYRYCREHQPEEDNMKNEERSIENEE